MLGVVLLSVSFHAECRYDECIILTVFILRVTKNSIMLRQGIMSLSMPSAVMLSVIVTNVVAPNSYNFFFAAQKFFFVVVTIPKGAMLPVQQLWSV